MLYECVCFQLLGYFEVYRQVDYMSALCAKTGVHYTYITVLSSCKIDAQYIHKPILAYIHECMTAQRGRATNA